jgi:hypothetical protein
LAYNFLVPQNHTGANKLEDRRKQEAFTRVCDYDLKRLCYLWYLENIDIWVGVEIILSHSPTPQ